MDRDSATRLGVVLILIITAMFDTSESMGQSDINCLRSIQESLKDLNGDILWQFQSLNERNSNICFFDGVACYGNERVFSLDLSNKGLRGEFPRGIANCTSLTGFDISYNNLHGPIPSDISRLIPRMNILDLSFNKLSGEIPEGIANLSSLYILDLSNNHLRGRIPEKIGNLSSLKSFTVVNNNLSGPVPSSIYLLFGASDFANNSGLCGYPLDPCAVDHNHNGKHQNLFIHGFTVGWAVLFVLSLVVGFFVPVERYLIKSKNSQWRRKPQNRHRPPLPSDAVNNIMVSMMEKFCNRTNYRELSYATNNFSNENIISTDETGTTYKSIHPNTWYLAVKRFHPILHLDHVFLSEFTAFGRNKHINLIPLVGFCISSVERLLIYKFMPNGSIYDWLFSLKFNGRIMGRSLRVKIIIGLVKWIVWLHQNEVVHGGISSNSVLLDADYNPRISGLYIRNHPLGSYEDDVYGFGTIVLELITGKKQIELIDQPGGVEEFVQSMLKQEPGVFDNEIEISCLLRIAAKCVDPDRTKRPSILEVYQFHLPLQWLLH